MKYLLLPLIAALALPAQVSANNLGLPNCNFLIRVSCITEETDNNGKYVGPLNNEAKRHGQGTYDWANGDQYVGEWQDNKRTGQGTYYWADGSSWTGEFINGRRTYNGSYN